MVGGEGEVEGPQVLDSCALGNEQEEQREAVGVDAGVGFDGRAEEEDPEVGQVGGEAAGLGSGPRRPPARSQTRQYCIQTVLLRGRAVVSLRKSVFWTSKWAHACSGAKPAMCYTNSALAGRVL